MRQILSPGVQGLAPAAAIRPAGNGGQEAIKTLVRQVVSRSGSGGFRLHRSLLRKTCWGSGQFKWN